jgi:hypothetical protein
MSEDCQRSNERFQEARRRRGGAKLLCPGAPLCIGGMRAAAFQFFGNFSELGREFEQCLPRVDLWRLFRERQAFFGMLAAFFRRRHDGDPSVQRPPGGIVPLPPLPMNRVVAGSILDNLEHWQKRAEEAAASRNRCQILTGDG